MLLDRVFAATASQAAASRTAALRLLEGVADGRGDMLGPELEVQVGLKPGRFKDADFKAPEVRAHALLRIGESGLPEALDYLKTLKPADFAADTSGQMWQAAQTALYQARLNGITDPGERIQFLERALRERNNSPAATWAVNQLCDSGTQISLPVIQETIRDIEPCQRGRGV